MTKSKPICIRLSQRCYNAWLYLEKCNINAVEYLRQGGEMAVINKANEFNFKERKIKDAPNWLYD